jgi:hypothetical protein
VAVSVDAGQLRTAGAAAFSGTDHTFVTFAAADATPSVADGNALLSCKPNHFRTGALADDEVPIGEKC